jgi:predicted N-formylglutamate amidohydrolase
MKLVLSCEHGGNEIPEKYQYLFKNNKTVLDVHNGYDLGALDVFNFLEPLSSASFFSTESRLLIELNRSLHHKNLFSKFSSNLSFEEKKVLINDYKFYRNAVEVAIKQYIDQKESVLHIAVHSFTPILNSIERNCDIGLLYDSTNRREKFFSSLFKKELLFLENTLKIRCNYPYLGSADGFTSYLRKQFLTNYIGIEIEINQKYSQQNKTDFFLKKIIYEVIRKIISS